MIKKTGVRRGMYKICEGLNSRAMTTRPMHLKFAALVVLNNGSSLVSFELYYLIGLHFTDKPVFYLWPKDLMHFLI